MKKILLIVLMVALVLPFFTASIVSAHEGDVCMWNSGYEFGQHHAEHARAGHLGGEHNPGNHQGYSGCVP